MGLIEVELSHIRVLGTHASSIYKNVFIGRKASYTFRIIIQRVSNPFSEQLRGAIMSDGVAEDTESEYDDSEMPGLTAQSELNTHEARGTALDAVEEYASSPEGLRQSFGDHGITNFDSLKQLHPFAQMLTISDLESCITLENATFPEDQRCSREKVGVSVPVAPSCIQCTPPYTNAGLTNASSLNTAFQSAANTASASSPRSDQNHQTRERQRRLLPTRPTRPRHNAKPSCSPTSSRRKQAMK